MTCASCGSTLPQAAAFCLRSGARRTDAADAPTVYTPADRTAGAAETRLTPSLTPSRSAASGRFRPGDLLAGRYRIERLLGRGGMGEVYRADDLTLDQTVALKFLPDAVREDPARLARFRAEVSVARQVSHPNVCRVYDIGEADGHIFLSMEFIDGEDLATLLRRIGRLAPDKAAEMARQLCAGLAAAHDRGVLHRDLKPANVMVDGRGRVRLADFGLAGAVASDTAGLAGTPAYMAPELFAGQPSTIQSDIYALGLVLYEMFTGKPAFAGATVNEIVRQHREATPTSLTQVVGEIDPAVDRVIQRCLSKDPAGRPASALAVSAALPGGDPLAAALAAGETPSPELVAASGGVGALRPLTATLLLAAVVALLAPVVWLAQRTQAIHYLPVERSPEVLADAARQTVVRLGFTDSPADSAHGFTPTDFIQHIESTDRTPARYERLRSGQPPGVTFWYRQSPLPLSTDSFLAGGALTLNNPPAGVPGMVNVMLDLKGRLHFLHAVPLRQQAASAPAAVDWAALLRETGFDESGLTPVAPTWVPPVYADARAAWTGVYPDRTDVPIRIEAAALGGVPVYFQIFEPWSDTTLGVRGPRRLSPAAILLFVVFIAVVVGAFLLARRNLRLGRGDETGAFRLALAICVAHVAAGLLGAHLTFDVFTTLRTVALLIGRGLLLGMVVYAFYMALEPDVRRRWPETLVAWSRVLTGRIADPLVGRDLLIGILVGVLHQLLSQLARRAPAWQGNAPGVTVPFSGFDGGTVTTLAAFLNTAAFSVLLATTLLLVFFLLFLIVRRRSYAIAAFAALLLTAAAFSQGWSLGLVFAAGSVAVLTTSVARLGLLALIVSLATSRLLEQTPLTIDPGSWAFPASTTELALLLATAIFGFRTALAGQRLVDSRLLD